MMKQHLDPPTKLVHFESRRVVVPELFIAETFYARFLGLMGQTLQETEGLLLVPCKEIHMYFCKQALDIVFLRASPWSTWGIPPRNWQESQLTVVSTRENVQPWRAFPLKDSKAHVTLELPPGSIQKRSITKGEAFCISS